MLLENFNYDLPEKLIAQKPLPHREQSRMMVLNRTTQEITHTLFSRFPEFLNKGDLLVLNNSRVIPARVWGKNRDRDIEFLFLKKRQKKEWEVLCRPAKHVRQGDTIIFSSELAGEVTAVLEEGKRFLRFKSADILPRLNKIGYAPLPPYIKRKPRPDGMRTFDLDRYQTVFAGRDGSIAAPTAGLHFTLPTLERIRKKEVSIEYLTLDVGLATFQPVRTEHIEDHQMLDESYEISSSTAAVINRAREEKRPVVAVGTTSVRALESSAEHERIAPGSHSTGLYIYPGYEFRMVDRLLTNFHLPKSTLLMLVSAFSGYDYLMRAYREAIEHKYRFFSYGDCMYIHE